MWEMLLGNIATDLIEQTASTPRVQQAVELSLAPAFLLVGIGGIMNVMMSRLLWIAGRIERLSDSPKGSCEVTHANEVEWLCQRRTYARRAIKFSTGAASVISVVIALLFISAYVDARIGTLVAALWVLTVTLLICGLTELLRETFLAAREDKSMPKK